MSLSRALSGCVAAVVLALIALPAQAAAEVVKVRMETAAGAIVLELYPDRAPITVANFLKHVDMGLYDGASFYRVVRPDNELSPEAPSQLIQGGLDFEKGGPLPPIAHEGPDVTGLIPLAGAVGMGRNALGTESSEFFINVVDNLSMLPGGQRGDGLGIAIFGRVSQGMDVVRAIQQGATGGNAGAYPEAVRKQVLSRPVAITAARRLAP